MKIKLIVSSILFVVALSVQAKLVTHFDMSVIDGKIEETVSGQKFDVGGHFSPENVDGAVGKALRFDGYTSYIDAKIGDVISSGSKKMTVSVWVALPCYPIIQLDTDTSEKTPIVTCLDSEARSGFGFYIGFNGKYSFRTFIGGWPVNIDVNTPLPTYQWNNLVVVIDCDSRSIKLYNNGVEVGSARANGTISLPASDFYMGQGMETRFTGPFELMSFNGLVDDVSIWDEAKDIEEIQSWKPENDPDLNIPKSRFADELQRPVFHGMPAAGWTNECHGMWYSDGRYHLFFQKNANGPYMARLHWGHISSENLYDWREEKIALAPGESYDMKGCWSGCVFSDEIITNGQPNIIYTAVDYVKATIAQAMPESETLEKWNKFGGNPIINGRPSGLSDDFRDPYFFRNDDNAYIIVGSSKYGIGTTTLHRYNQQSASWSNTGECFFSGKDKAQDGTFWEMPNITKMQDGKWLFTATPQNTANGVRTLYWVGSINEDGTFAPDIFSEKPRLVELTSQDGFGMLSPTIFKKDGKTIVLGIVPDKLNSQVNWNLGWAHCYSLPREWSLDENGTLIQKPYEGLAGLRTETTFTKNEFELVETIDLSPVRGRAIELYGDFEIGNSNFGFKFFKGIGSEASVYYNPSQGELVADFSNLRRLSNDNGVYDGIYHCPLPQPLQQGEHIKINIFIDHSIVDIFVNNLWATSIRVFPTEEDAEGVEAFVDGGNVKVSNLNAWILSVDGNTSGIDKVIVDNFSEDKLVDVYSIDGICLKKNVVPKEVTNGLKPGIYIAGNRKIVVN